MAAGSVIGALRVVLGADTAAFETGLKKAEGRLSKFGGMAGKAMVAAGAAVAAAAGVLGVAMNNVVDQADKLFKLSQQIGVPVEDLSRLAHAADLSGVSLESLSKGVGRLNRNMVESAQGLETPTRAFETLGIEIRNADQSMKTVSEILPELADKFNAMRDGPEKTALSMQLLGRSGMELIPMLNMGAAGMREMMMEADQLGITISAETGKAAEDFNDNLTRLNRAAQGIVTQVTANMLPAMRELSQIFVDAAKNSDLMKASSDGITAAIKGAVKVAVTAVTVFQRLGAELNALWAVLQSDNLANTKKVWAEFIAEGQKTEAALAGIGQRIEAFFATAAANAAAAAPEQGKQLAAPMIQNAVEAKKAAAEVEKSVAQAQAAQERIREQGMQVFAETRTPLEALSEEMARLNMLLNQGAIDFETWQRAAQMAAYNAETSMVQASQGLASAFGGAINEAIAFLGTFGQENKAAAIAAIALSKGLAIAQVIQTTAAASMAAFLPPPIGAGPLGGAALAGAIKAMGALQIGLIAATGIAQAASVGSRSVSAPSGGARSSVSRRSTEPAESAGASGPDRSINITLKGESFTREQVRDLVEGINDFIKDGGRLVVSNA